jgi:hypothetical protein
MNKVILVVRLGLALVLGAASVMWGVRQWDTSWKTAEWHALAAFPKAETLADIPTPPNEPAAWLEMAGIYENVLFPPAYDQAALAYGEAIKLDPQRSAPWMHLARVKLLSGNVEQAQAALAQSDKLDPRFPSERAEAVQLWALSGDFEAALNLAKHIADIGPEGRRVASRELVLAGFGAEEVFDRLDAVHQRGRALAELVIPLITRDTDATRALLGKLPEDVWDDPSFARPMLQPLTRPLVHEYAMRAWDTSFRSGTAGVGIPPVGLVNATLHARPFDDPRVLGWQAAPRGGGVAVRHRDGKEVQAPDDRGVIRLTFTDTTANVDEELSWRMYRLPVAGGTAMTIRAKVLLRPPDRSTCQLIARADGLAWRSGVSDWADEKWQTLEVTLPSAENDRIVELSFQRNRRGASDTTRPEIYIAGIEAMTHEDLGDLSFE